ncbi:transposase zinc-binding domain-containing protein [Fusobacterium sp. HC1336]|uniref:transposase zinc-binding domain-containing protein n=1 Tax=Fusobacterium sp. HC1336 TaxID=3171169 RepID=UPI003F28C16F
MSCKSRLCPACSKKYAALWADKTAASLINTKHRAVLKRKLKSLLLLFIKKYEIFLIIKLPSITKIFLIIRKKLKLLWT